MRYRDQNGHDWAEIIDFLMMWPDATAGGAAARRDRGVVTPSGCI
jgi:hypothetical protein